MATYPATNSKEASELLIDVSNQMHEIVNEDATTEVMTESGLVPSVRKALADTFLFQEPIAWNQGSDETAFNQLRTFDGDIYWAPTATIANPIPMGVTPVGDNNWKLAPVNPRGYQGLWPDTGGSALKGETWQTQIGGTPTGEYYTALKNTSVDPVGDNVNWKVNISARNISNPNLISNSSFEVAGSVTIPPNATPRSYNEGDELFSGFFAPEDLVNVTYIDGKLNGEKAIGGTGQLYVDIYKTEKQKLSTAQHIASIASSDGVPVESGASFVDNGDYWRVTFDMNDTFSVKFEQGSVATKHDLKVPTFKGIKNIDEFISQTSRDITEAVKYCFENGYALELNAVSIQTPYRITSDVRMPTTSRIFGSVRARYISGNLETPGVFDDVRQAYILMENASILGGTTADTSDRGGMYWSDICFLGASDPRPESANRAVKPCLDGSFGGNSEGIFFQGFKKAVDNPFSYFLTIDRTAVIACDEGYVMDDWNSSSISNFYFDFVGNAFSSGKDPQASSLMNVGGNMRPETDILLKISDQVKIDGYCYLEQFGAGKVGSTGIQVVLDAGSKGKPLDMQNVQFQFNDADYMMTIDCVDDGDPSIKVQAGRVANCRFFDARIEKVGFGIHNDFDGNPTTSLGVIKDFDTESCSGISYSDLTSQIDSPYKQWANFPYYTYYNDTTKTDLSSSVITRVNLSEVDADIVESNRVGNLDGNNFTTNRPGVYRVEFNVSVRNETDIEIRASELFLRLLRNGTSTEITLAKSRDSIQPRFGASDFYKDSVSLSACVFLDQGDKISLQGRNSGVVDTVNINANYFRQ